MNKSEFVSMVAEESNLTKKDAKDVLNVISQLIKDSLNKGETIRLNGFGKFEVKERSERTAINPRTNEKMIIPKTKVACFKAGKELKTAIG